jgi:phosphoserine aminotransferase
MPRIFNFAPGPSMLPTSVMEQAQAEFLNFQNTGMSAMEIPHRGAEFAALAEKMESTLRDILSIPDNYTVLMMQGGSHLQYAAIPMNLLKDKTSAAYVDTGHWSKAALNEAKKYCDVNVLEGADPAAWHVTGDEAYLHYVDNETIGGFEFPSIPDDKGLTLVCDMSSNILSRPFDISRFGLVYACAQKNMGPVGNTLVIVRTDLIGDPLAITPSMCSYPVFLDKQSMYNTPVTYPWYLSGLVCEWVKSEGGLAEMDRRAKHRANKFYAYLDQSDFYSSPVDLPYRSRMNVPFLLKDESKSAAFLEQSLAVGLANLKGHRSVGGMRASIYNAMPEAGIDALITFMRAFEDEVQGS